jgi:hypothetical protein
VPNLPRYTTVLCERDTKELFKPMELMVPILNLGTDNSVGKSLKELATSQARKERIQEIIQIVEQKQKMLGKMSWCKTA